MSKAKRRGRYDCRNCRREVPQEERREFLRNRSLCGLCWDKYKRESAGIPSEKHGTDLTAKQYICISKLYYRSLDNGAYGNWSINKEIMEYMSSVGRRVSTPGEAFFKAKGIVERGIFSLTK